ncbi:MAG: peptide deformylase [Spirochaetes bacterium]|nr:peptide deformylase [Spirochaetota bacterium]
MNILTLGDPFLKKTSALVPDINGNIASLVGEMFDAMGRARGLGLAAVQVGELIRLFVTLVPRDEPRVFINPDILETSIEEVSYEEGCLSIPGLNADVSRPASVRVQAWGEKGRPFTLNADGLLARVIQHEMDHLNGILFIDRLESKKRSRLITEYQEKLRL